MKLHLDLQQISLNKKKDRQLRSVTIPPSPPSPDKVLNCPLFCELNIMAFQHITESLLNLINGEQQIITADGSELTLERFKDWYLKSCFNESTGSEHAFMYLQSYETNTFNNILDNKNCSEYIGNLKNRAREIKINDIAKNFVGQISTFIALSTYLFDYLKEELFKPQIKLNRTFLDLKAAIQTIEEQVKSYHCSSQYKKWQTEGECLSSTSSLKLISIAAFSLYYLSYFTTNISYDIESSHLYFFSYLISLAKLPHPLSSVATYEYLYLNYEVRELILKTNEQIVGENLFLLRSLTNKLIGKDKQASKIILPLNFQQKIMTNIKLADMVIYV